MARRFAIVTIILAAFLILAVPAFAANGARDDYTTSAACATCHQSDSVPYNAPKVFDLWLGTKHAVSNEENQGSSIPNGSTCGGCHVANYAPAKVQPTPTQIRLLPTPSGTPPVTPSPTATQVRWGADIASPFPAQALGDAPYSEPFIGCSSCHYGMNVAGNSVLKDMGNDPADTAHTAPMADLNDADICGGCHSRYSYTVSTIPVTPLPYVKLDASGSPIPNPSPTSLIQPQMAIGYPVLHDTPLSDYLNVPVRGWVPTPDPSATSAAGLQVFWTYEGAQTRWQSKGHDGGAAQYPEWKAEAHADSLIDLKAEMGDNPPASCLQCHSADYRNAPSGQKPTGAQAKYGITCTGCHTPHEAGQKNGVWDKDSETRFDTQLVGNPDNPSDLCATCHNSQIGSDVQTAGATVYQNQKEVMLGTGAIGVPNGLLKGQHEGKCVDCHMPPTYTGNNKAANHTFRIIEPVRAANVDSIGGAKMPYSACSTCHSKADDPLATGMQPTMDARQADMQDRYADIALNLHDAGLRMGYAHAAPTPLPEEETVDENYDRWLNAELNTKGSSAWTADELKWQQAFTDWTYIGAEGSWGVHNWSYIVLVADTAHNMANQVESTPQKVTFKVSKTRAAVNTKITYSGTLNPATTGKMQIQKKNSSGVYVSWKTATVSGGKYSVTVKMTKKGTFYFKAFFPAKAPYAGGKSGSIKVVIH